VCDVFIKAERDGGLHESQSHIADRAHIIMKGLALVGIAGLMMRRRDTKKSANRHALQAILDQYLRRNSPHGAQRFPEEFYKQIFRLKGWEWRWNESKSAAGCRSLHKGHWYERLAPEA